MAIQLPGVQSQAGGLTPTVVREDTSNDLVSALGLAANLVNTFDRAKAAEAKKEAATQDAADDTTIGNMLADQNEIDLQSSHAIQRSSDLQESAIQVTRAKEDGLITDAEQLVIDQYHKDVARMDLLKAQNPSAFSGQKASIQKKVAFQQVLRENPRLGARLVAARNSLSAGPDAVSGAQVKGVMETEQRIQSVYGNNPTPDQRLEFAELKLMNDRNVETGRANEIKAKAGELSLGNIMKFGTSKLDLTIAAVNTKFTNDSKVSGGYAKADNVAAYVQILKDEKNDIVNTIYSSVAAQNAAGKGIINRASVNEQVASIEKQIDDTIELYQSNSTPALMKQITEFQVNYLKINGGNVADTAKTLAGIRGDNMGSMMAVVQTMKGTNEAAAQGWQKIMDGSGMGGFAESKEKFAVQLATMMSNGVPLPNNLQRAAVAHGILAAREGPINEPVQEAILEGASTMATEDGVPSAVKVLLDAPLARQLSGPKLKGTVTGMDQQIKNDIRSSRRSVSYDPETDQLLVFGVRGEKQVDGNTFLPQTRTLTSEERIVPDADLTKSLNSLYDLRRSGKYAEDLETTEQFIKNWTDLFGMEGFKDATLPVPVTAEPKVETKPVSTTNIGFSGSL